MINMAFFTALVLVTIRLSGMFIAAPAILPSGTPNLLKGILILILGYIITPVIDYSSVVSFNEAAKLTIQGLNEFSTGLTVGFIINLFFISARIAGNIMDIQIGFSMATLFDPASNSNSTYSERIFNLISIMIFFIIDGHHFVLRAIIATFEKIKVGGFLLNQNTLSAVFKVFSDYFVIGIKIALPIILVILVSDILLGTLSRTMPQLNIMILGMPIKLLIGFGLMSACLPFLINLIHNSFEYLPKALEKVFSYGLFLIIFADEKTEEATSKKLSDAKKKGQVARSKDLSLAVTFLAACLGIIALGNYFINKSSNIILKFITNFNITINEGNLFKIFYSITLDTLLLILPIAVLVMVTGIAINISQVGFMNTAEPLKPDFKKLNPVNGLKRIFSIRSLVDLLKNVIIITVVGFVGYKLVMSNLTNIMLLINLKNSALFFGLKDIVGSIMMEIAFILAMIGAADFFYQRRKFKKEMRMSKQEVKEEFKQMDGDPEIKAKRKQRMRELSRARMMSAVPEATVVVTNPTHLAVALKYEEGKNQAPIVVAKGADLIALKIKDIAKNSKVPIIENKPLARMIYNEVEIEEEIPIEMYQAVAEILAVVLRMKKGR